MSVAGDRRRNLTPEQKRELILRAAAEEFGRMGHRDARLDDIARAARTTRAGIYDHFADKRQLHAAVIARATRDALEGVAASVGPPGRDRAERYRDGLLASFRLVVERPDVRMMLLGVPGAPQEVTRALSDAQATVRQGMAQLYLSDAGFLEDDPRRGERAEEVAQAVIGTVMGLAAYGLERGLDPEHLADSAMKLVWPGVEAMHA
jgi:AcrR family transcriptional regulator